MFSNMFYILIKLLFIQKSVIYLHQIITTFKTYIMKITAEGIRQAKLNRNKVLAAMGLEPEVIEEAIIETKPVAKKVIYNNEESDFDLFCEQHSVIDPQNRDYKNNPYGSVVGEYI